MAGSLEAFENRLELLTWRDVESYLERDQRLALVLGAVEQHGYLALGNDTLNALEVARRATQAERVLLAPPLHYGISTLMAAFPGTMSLSVRTFGDVVRELVGAAYRSGFTRLMIFNGNGPHYLLLPHLTELMDQFHGLVCDWFEWFTEPEIIRALEAVRPRGETHSNWGENWPDSRPVNYAPPVDEPWWEYRRNVFLHSPAEVRSEAPSGSFGGDQEVDDAEIEPIIDLVVETARSRLRRLLEPGG